MIDNKFNCHKCGGSGEQSAGTFKVEYARDMGYSPDKCPDCNGIGYLMLGVESNCKRTSYEPHCKARRDLNACTFCSGKYLRPLTSDELEELFKKADATRGLPFDQCLRLIRIAVEMGMNVSFNNQQVSILTWESPG